MTKEELKKDVTRILGTAGAEVEQALNGGFEIRSGVWIITAEELRQIQNIAPVETISVEGGKLTIRTKRA